MDNIQLNPIETDMEAQKEPLLNELKLGKFFVAKFKDVDFAARVPLKIEAIDDTVLLGSFQEKTKRRSTRKAKIAKRVSNEELHEESKNLWNDDHGINVIKEHDDLASCKKGLQKGKRRSRNKELEKQETMFRTKIMYSRNELESSRFVNVEEQKNLWKYVYDGLGVDVINEYEDLARCKHRNFDKKAGLGLHSTIGTVARRGTRVGAGIIVR